MKRSKFTHLYYLILIFLLVPFYSLFAISDTFTVTQLIGSDSIAPTIPTPITATPISDTQIDITWGASTDDQNLSGYRLFRDATQIATTSLITYSDTGLSASTTYSYTVEAYDWFFNISTTSVAAATTTLPASVVVATSTPTTTTNVSQTGTLMTIRLHDLDITTTQTSVNLSWLTNRYSQFALRWGKVSAYDLGFVQNNLFKKSHKTTISDLEPGTTYVYELIAYDQRGKAYTISRDTFTTDIAPDNIAPVNVSNVSYTTDSNDVTLFWKNSKESDLAKIRIVRNYNFYPRDPANGYIAYEGLKEFFFDRGAFNLYKTQYYTIFSYDDSGNVSSGSIVSVKQNEEGIVMTDGSETIIVPTTKSTSSVTVPKENSDNHTTARVITFSDVRVIQNDIWIEPIENIVRVRTDVPITLEIPFGLLSKNLKTITVTINDTSSLPVSYMLRINKDKTMYRAVLPSRTYSGENVLTFSIYDYKTQLLTTFDGILQVEEGSMITQVSKQIFQSEFFVKNVLLKFSLLVTVIIFYLLYRRRRRG